MSQPRWIVHVDGDAFAVAVERVSGRAPTDRAVLVGQEAGGRGLVTCASYEARRVGIRGGMSLGAARWRLPQAWIVSGDPIAYEQAAQRVHEFLCQKAPVVEWAALDDFILDMTGCVRWCGGEIGRWATQLVQQLRAATGLPFSAGIASSKMLAKVAMRLAKPGGVVLVRQGCEEEFLQGLALRALPGWKEEEWRLLEELGFRTVSQARQLGEAGLRGLFGQRGEEYWARLTGRWQEAVVPTPRRPVLEADHLFQPDTCDPMMVAAGMQLLVERLGWELRRRKRRCHTMRFTGVYGDGRLVRRQVRFLSPTDRTDEFAQVARRWLATLLRRRVRVRHLRLEAETEAGGAELWDFLEDSRAKRTVRLYEAVDRVRERYGLTSLLSATALPSVQRAPIPTPWRQVTTGRMPGGLFGRKQGESL